MWNLRSVQNSPATFHRIQQEVIHSDICGQITVPSLDDARYFAMFIDDNIMYIEMVMLKQRSEIFTVVKSYKARLEKESGHTIKRLSINQQQQQQQQKCQS